MRELLPLVSAVADRENSLGLEDTLQLNRTAFPAGTEGTQIVERVNACAMAIVPMHFDGVVADRAYFQQFRVRRRDESPLRAMALT